MSADDFNVVRQPYVCSQGIISLTGVSAMASTRSSKTNRWLSVSTARFVVVALALLSPLATAVTARADVADDKFISILKSDDINHESVSAAIAAGHKACDYLDGGMTANEVATDVMAASSLPEYDAGYFVGAAIKAYCPRHIAELTPAPATATP
jgi:hypothetical protein